MAPTASGEAAAGGRRADVKLGFSCNNRCVFCVQGDKRHRHPDRSLDEIRGILAAERARCDSLVLTGGEVTLRRDLPEVVAHARDLGFRTIQLQTNGRALAVPAYLDRLVAAGVTELSPAIHGPDAACHDAQTRAPGSFRQVVKGVLNARQRGIPVVTNSVITRHNLARLAALAELLVGLDVQQFQLAFVHALGSAGADFDAVVPRMREVRPHVQAALAIGREAGVPCLTEAIPLCILGEDRAHAAEHRIPPTRIVDAERTIEDYTLARREEAKAKGPACAGCAWDAACEGPWREYPERFGWGEFSPVAA